MRPTLIYDGDCGICRRWVRYWEALTGPQISYRPYQEAAADLPAIPLDSFRKAIQFVDADGRVHSGAAATFLVLRHVPGRALWWWLYRHLPGFAPIAEWSYGFFARRRGLLSALTTLLWGRTLEAERYDLVSDVFLRGLGLIYLAAFASLAVQVRGLIGSDGILPVAAWLEALQQQEGNADWWFAPTLFWLNASDTALVAGTWVGMGLAILIVVRRFERVALAASFALYLSYAHAGQDFMMFQWDLLLLEAGFLAIFLPNGSRIVVWLYRWLAFRYLLMAGAAKLVSGDVAWRGLTALSYHFETQPLPTPLAWDAAHAPSWMLAGGTAAALVTEVVLVFLIFAPRRLRMFVAWCVLIFQLLILLTGNYNFFNLLTMLLCVFLFDDAALRRWTPARVVQFVNARAAQPGRNATALAALLALFVIAIGLERLSHMFLRAQIPVISAIDDATSSLLIVNPYGLFAIMTTTRPEIVVEGSNDGVEWREYEFHYKPGSLSRRPPWNIPHQPRLDWQMWFAALGGSWEDSWFTGFLVRLLQGSRSVLLLLQTNPFPDHPPKFVRATLYDYKFADPAIHARTGQWWVRTRIREFAPPFRLRDTEKNSTDSDIRRE